MAIQNKIQGQDLMLFVKTGDGTLKSIAFSTNHTLSTSLETQENSSKDEGCGRWQSYTPGMMQWSVTSENLMAEKATNGHTFNSLFDVYLKREPVEVAFALQKDYTDLTTKLDTDWDAPTTGWSPSDNQYSGKALITNLEVTATNGQVATYSISLQGVGNLKKVGNGIVASTASLSAVSDTPIATVSSTKTK